MRQPEGSFEEEYRQGTYRQSGRPPALLLSALEYVSSGRACDLGTGEGKKALFLAERGFDVLGVDASETGISRFLSAAGDLGVAVEGEVADLRTYEPRGHFDLVLCLSTLHFLGREAALALVERMKGHTSPGGVHVVKTFTVDDPCETFPYRFERGELERLYLDWEILHHDERVTPPEDHGGTVEPHRHGIAEVLARNPTAASLDPARARPGRRRSPKTDSR